MTDQQQDARPLAQYEFPSPDPERPYVYPGTEVLINKLGIRNAEAFKRVSIVVSVLRTELSRLQPLPGNFDLDHLRAIHRYLFQDIFPWAGELRMVDMTKNQLFFEKADIDSRAHEIFTLLREENYLRGLEQDAFIDRISFFYASVNRIHPFREGNNRTQRLFFEQLAKQAGYRVDFPTHTRSLLREACQASHNGDLTLFREMFRQITSRL